MPLAHVSNWRCNLAGINVRTLQRWKAGAGRLVQGDKRPWLCVPSLPMH